MELVFYEKHNLQLLNDYQLTEEQLNYTDMPTHCVEEQKADSSQHAILAMKNGQFVTFFVLQEKEGVALYSNNPTAILVRAFSTDARFLGQGYAKEALQLLPSFIRTHFSHIDEIVLAVNRKNTVAQHLYKKNGFVDEGIRKMGQNGELIVMSHHLSTSGEYG